MKILRRLYGHYEAYHEHSGLLLHYMSVLGLLMLPALYSMRFFKESQAYDDFGLRLFAMTLCLSTLLRSRWPRSLKGAFMPYSYFVMTVCLPFFFVFTSLKNGGGTVAVANTFMATFMLLLLADWRNMIVMLLVGSGSATLMYFLTDPAPRLPDDYVGRLPLLMGTIVGASLFKYALEQVTAERVRHAYASLAGSIAHEMRNPPGRIRHNLECMQDALPAPSTTGDPQVIGSDNANALYRLVAESEIAVKRGLQVIAMTLDEVSARPIDRAGFSLISAAEATRKALQEYAFQGDEEAERVELRVTSDFVFRGDETAYVFAIFNLVKSALYYLPAYPDARIAITVGEQRVSVRDTGPGIAPEIQARLFRPFASSGKTGGTGLGLAYCRRVMEAFGGSIRCDSEYGKYTEFILGFPPVPAEEIAARQKADMDSARTVFGGKRLLVVDDDAAQRMITRHKLAPLEVQVDQAGDGQQALEMLSRQSYDLVELALNMPVMDGYAVARALRQGRVPLHRDVAIVAHTSDPAHIAAVKSRSAGMDAFVGKPCTAAHLVQAMREAQHARSTAQAALERRLAGRHILIADDAAHNRKTVAAYLRHVGCVVVQASHGGAVLEQLKQGASWDVVVLVINMPGLDGLQPAAAIRRLSSEVHREPIIAVTAHCDEAT